MIRLSDEEYLALREGTPEERGAAMERARISTGFGFKDIMATVEMMTLGITEADLTPLALYKAIQALRREIFPLG